MKVAIITLHAIDNYGSVLQTYATEKLFQQQGCEVETINYIRETAVLDSVWKILKAKNLSYKQKIKTLISFYLFSNSKRKIVMDVFRKNYLHLTEKTFYSDKDLEECCPNADLFCTGSDQTWNTVCQGGVAKPFFLHFVSPEKRKMSYAASFGITSLPQKDEKEVKNLLASYNAVSVRETSGIEILRKLGIKGMLVLDPTLAVNPLLWYELAAPRMIKEEYLLAYQLNRNTKFTKYMKDYSKNHSLKIVQVRSHVDTKLKNGVCLTSPTPQEWLSLILHAKCVLTDSFHATAFCMIFHKKFMIIHPSLYSSRIDDFLAFVGLDSQIIDDYSVFSYCDTQIDFSQTDKILDVARNNSVNFLKNAILS